MKNKILKLRKKGKSYNEIVKILGCSKSIVSYHCGEGQKEKWQERQRKNRRRLEIIIRTKADKFLERKVKKFRLRTKIHRERKVNSSFNYETAYKKIIENPVCYITGRNIDLSQSRMYELDHIRPASKGGKNTLTNMGLACMEVNRAKYNMSLDEFIQLCVDVCRHNGFIVKRM
jgi:5-methylcytosine-specific restriction endonuclease McrA